MKLKRGLGIKVFDIDAAVSEHMRSSLPLEIMPKLYEEPLETKRQIKNTEDSKEKDFDITDQINKVRL